MSKIFVFILLLITGCASQTKQEISQLHEDVSDSQQKIDQSKEWLSNNSNVYYSNECHYIEKGARPDFSCESNHEAEIKSLAICSIKYKGCDATLYLLKDKLNSTTKEYLASQVCQFELAKYLNEERTANDVIVDTAAFIADKKCEENGNNFSLACITSFGLKVKAFSDFATCVNNIGYQCQSNYAAWDNKPQDLHNKCEDNKNIITTEQGNIDGYNTKLQEKRNSLIWKLFGDDS